MTDHYNLSEPEHVPEEDTGRLSDIREVRGMPELPSLGQKKSGIHQLILAALAKKKKERRVRKTSRYSELGPAERREDELRKGRERCQKYRAKQNKLREEYKKAAAEGTLTITASIFAKGEAVEVVWSNGEAVGRNRVAGKVKGWVIGFGQTTREGKARVHVVTKTGLVMSEVHPSLVTPDKERHLMEVAKSKDRKERRNNKLAKNGVFAT